MFKCERCGMQSQPHQPMFRVPVEFRQKEYVHVTTTNLVKTIEHKSKGYEIVKEIAACEACAHTLDNQAAMGVLPNLAFGERILGQAARVSERANLASES